MKKLHFSIYINATPEKVWNILWNNETYPKWTRPFCEGSQAVTDWKEGSSILFLDGKNNGMYSKIETRVPYEYMAFKHIGEVKDGVEQPVDEGAQKWTGAMETYSLKESDGGTELIAEVNDSGEMEDYLKTTFPKAMEEVKKLAEV